MILTSSFAAKVKFPSVEIFEPITLILLSPSVAEVDDRPVVTTSRFPAMLMFEPAFVVVSTILLPPSLLCPQYFSVRLRSSKLEKVASFPAVISALSVVVIFAA